ncbi:polyisoprenoid-binding protein [Novosphingobium sp. YJ-S2-02]|uniref:Polyisoprenoid-binding protein n=1 Tax=Novosphingobium aureum TaxID=2792964 RepID=A0A931HAW0_9SPHN|nr:YceI family protein [Novosphingobium aureum]MBH0112158.1 polyisoprenoid-binding protein [Novosphingobium aureum]
MTKFTFKSVLLPVALLAAAPVVLNAQVSDPAPAAAQAGNYDVETSHTRVGFAVNHFGFSDWFGEFADVTGTLSIDPAKIEKAKVAVTIPVATVSTTNATLDGELVSADWFDAETYPTIQFVSTKVVRTGERTADVTGNLTFHGVTKPVTLKASFNAGGVNPMSKAYTVGFNASGTIKRSEFGVTKYVPVVGDDVTLRISAAFEKAE